MAPSEQGDWRRATGVACHCVARLRVGEGSASFEKKPKTIALLPPCSPRQPRKSFLVLLFKKELLPIP
jgi:hypothetical protein